VLSDEVYLTVLEWPKSAAVDAPTATSFGGGFHALLERADRECCRRSS
jgi:hypothetical protein